MLAPPSPPGVTPSQPRNLPTCSSDFPGDAEWGQLHSWLSPRNQNEKWLDQFHLKCFKASHWPKSYRLRWSCRLKEAKANPTQLHRGSHPLLRLLPNLRGPLALPAHTDRLVLHLRRSGTCSCPGKPMKELQGLGSLSGIKGPALGTRHGVRKWYAFNNCRMDAKCGTEANALVRPGKGKALVLQNWDRGLADNLRQPAGIRVGIWLGKPMPSLSKENLRKKRLRR